MFIDTENTPMHPPFFRGETISIGCKASGYPNIGGVYFTTSTDPSEATGRARCVNDPTGFGASDDLNSDLGLERLTTQYCRTAALSDPFILRLTGPITNALEGKQLYCHLYDGARFESAVPVTVISNIQG